MNPDEVLEILGDSLKGIIIRPATKCEMVFDIALTQQICLENGLKLGLIEIKDLIVAYCHTIKAKNSRVLQMEIRNPSDTVLEVDFAVRLFASDELPVLDRIFAEKAVVSSGEWRKGSGELVEKERK